MKKTVCTFPVFYWSLERNYRTHCHLFFFFLLSLKTNYKFRYRQGIILGLLKSRKFPHLFRSICWSFFPREFLIFNLKYKNKTMVLYFTEICLKLESCTLCKAERNLSCKDGLSLLVNIWSRVNYAYLRGGLCQGLRW